MTATVLQIDPRAPSADVVGQAVRTLQSGGLVVFPTETVYGLGARADRPEAMARLRGVKTRDGTRAFTVHIADREAARDFAPNPPSIAARLIRKGWPGPLTLVLPVPDPAHAPVMAGRNGSVATAIYFDNTIGLRCPDDAVAQQILRGVDAPVVASSANRAGAPPPWTGRDVIRELSDQVDLIVDSGRTKYARPSTIVRVSGSGLEVLREGVYDTGSVQRLATVRLLFVCTGNTCRSPMAARLAEKMLADRLNCRLEHLADRGVFVSSAGSSGGFGSASAEAVKVLARRGLDLSGHVSTALSTDLIGQADYIFAMTRSHRDRIIELSPPAQARLQLLLDDQDLPDPVGGTVEEYERCARTIEDGLKRRLQEVIV